MDLGRSIRKARKGRFTQKQIASLTGVTDIYISYVENNMREPSLRWIRSFCEIVNMPVPALFFYAMNQNEVDWIKNDRKH